MYFRESELLRNTFVIFFTECTRLQLQISSSDTRSRMGIDWHVGRSLSCSTPVQTEYCLNSLQEPLLWLACAGISAVSPCFNTSTRSSSITASGTRKEKTNIHFFLSLSLFFFFTSVGSVVVLTAVRGCEFEWEVFVGRWFDSLQGAAVLQQWKPLLKG